ncbi:MAG: hypothetical protein ABI183_26360, partial [Polyangiaceae bacterium]
MKARSLFLALVVSTVACGGGNGAGATTPSQPDTAKAYPIRLHRQAHVGDRAQIVFDELEDNSTIMRLESSGKEISNERTTKRSHLEGVTTTIALDARQDELRGTLDVKTLNIDDHVILQNKRVEVTKARKADDAILTVDGAPVSPELRKALKDLLELRVGGPTDDDIFGTTRPQLAGGHWPINSERARADFADEQGAGLATSMISGET